MLSTVTHTVCGWFISDSVHLPAVWVKVAQLMVMIEEVRHFKISYYENFPLMWSDREKKKNFKAAEKEIDFSGRLYPPRTVPSSHQHRQASPPSLLRESESGSLRAPKVLHQSNVASHPSHTGIKTHAGFKSGTLKAHAALLDVNRPGKSLSGLHRQRRPPALMGKPLCSWPGDGLLVSKSEG